MASVSVVIPVRNRPQLIRTAIESCLSQTVPPDEIVVTDDGSTDETPAVLAELAAQNPGIVVLRREQGGGAASARNHAAAHAKGDYIAFLDSDDVWEPTKLEKQLALAALYPEAPGIFTGLLYEFTDRDPRVSIPAARVSYSDLQPENRVVTSTALVRRSDFEAVGGFDIALPNCEDWDLWLRLAFRGDLHVVQEPLIRYSFSADNKLSRDHEKLLRGHELVFEKVLAAPAGRWPRPFLEAMHELTRASNDFRITGQRTRGWRHLGAALRRSRAPEVLRRAVRLAAFDVVHGGRA